MVYLRLSRSNFFMLWVKCPHIKKEVLFFSSITILYNVAKAVFGMPEVIYLLLPCQPGHQHIALGEEFGPVISGQRAHMVGQRGVVAALLLRAVGEEF